MDVSNSTGQDTRYTVTSGPPTPARNRESGDLRPGHRNHWIPSSPGPWTITFQVGAHTYTGIAGSPLSEVELVEAAGVYKVVVVDPPRVLAGGLR
jgi:hypothetical protein